MGAAGGASRRSALDGRLQQRAGGAGERRQVTFSSSSKARLTPRDVGRFPGKTLFDRLARVVCQAGCLPREVLCEAWEMARRIRRRLRGGRVGDLGAGHGLLSHALLLLDDWSPEALLVDTAPPPSAARLHA